MNAVNGLIDWTTSPDSGSLKVGMRGSFLVSAEDTLSEGPGLRIVAAAEACVASAMIARVTVYRRITRPSVGAATGAPSFAPSPRTRRSGNPTA